MRGAGVPPDRNGTTDCADEVTLSRKGAKSGTRARKLRSIGTRAKTRVAPSDKARVTETERYDGTRGHAGSLSAAEFEGSTCIS
jgi:hypothetical protein